MCVCVNKGDDQIAIILDDVSKVETIRWTFWLRFLRLLIVTHDMGLFPGIFSLISFTCQMKQKPYDERATANCII